MKLTPKIQKAIDKATTLHHGQIRKGNKLPYIVHPFSVAIILSNYTDDEDTIIGGLMHDVLEDVKGYRFDDLVKDFNENIANIVKDVSEDKDPNIKEDKRKSWEYRKKAYIDHLNIASKQALMVCCADKIHNIQSTLIDYKREGEKFWDKFNASKQDRMDYHEQVLDIIKKRLDNNIVKELERVYLELKNK